MREDREGLRFCLRSDAERIECREREPRFDWTPADNANKLPLPVCDKFTGCIEAAQIDERCYLDVGRGDGSGTTQKQARHAPEDWEGNSQTIQLQNSPSGKVSRSANGQRNHRGRSQPVLVTIQRRYIAGRFWLAVAPLKPRPRTRLLQRAKPNHSGRRGTIV